MKIDANANYLANLNFFYYLYNTGIFIMIIHTYGFDY